MSANPLEDIANSRAIVGVISRGRYYDRERLDAILDGVAESVAR